MCLKKGSFSVTEIAEKVKEEQSKVSHNLIKLASCHIVEVEQKGKKRIYSLNKETVLPILKILETHVKKNCSMKEDCEICSCSLT